MERELMQFQTYNNAPPTFAIMFGMLTMMFCIGVPVIAHYWYKLRIKQWEMSLKHTMLERGMSAADIQAVLAATTIDSEKKHGCWSGRRNA
jgi:hypothetical protein